MTSTYLTEDWPLGPTSTVYMDGTALYSVRHYGKPGSVQVKLDTQHADLIRKVVAERIKQAQLQAWALAVTEALGRDFIDAEQAAVLWTISPFLEDDDE